MLNTKVRYNKYHNYCQFTQVYYIFIYSFIAEKSVVYDIGNSCKCTIMTQRLSRSSFSETYSCENDPDCFFSLNTVQKILFEWCLFSNKVELKNIFCFCVRALLLLLQFLWPLGCGIYGSSCCRLPRGHLSVKSTRCLTTTNTTCKQRLGNNTQISSTQVFDKTRTRSKLITPFAKKCQITIQFCASASSKMNTNYLQI